MRLLQFLQEENGQLSSARLLNLLLVIAIIVDYMHAVWTVGGWHPDMTLVAILLTTITGKTVQKFAESKPTPPAEGAAQ